MTRQDGRSAHRPCRFDSLAFVMLCLAAVRQTCGNLAHPDDVAAAVRFRAPHAVAGYATELAITAVGLVQGVTYRLVVSVARGGDMVHTDETSFTWSREMAAASGVVHASKHQIQHTLPPLTAGPHTVRATLLNDVTGTEGEVGLASLVQRLDPVECPEAGAPSTSRPHTSRNLCLLDGECFKHDQLGISAKHLVQYDDSDLAYRAWNVGSNAAACLARARQWHLHCGNPLKSPMTATYVPTLESYTFPEDGTQVHGDGEGEWVLLLHVTDGYLDFFDNFWKHYERIEKWSVPHVVKVVVASEATASYVHDAYGGRMEVVAGAATNNGDNQEAFDFFDKRFNVVV